VHAADMAKVENHYLRGESGLDLKLPPKRGGRVTKRAGGKVSGSHHRKPTDLPQNARYSLSGWGREQTQGWGKRQGWGLRKKGVKISKGKKKDQNEERRN